MFIIIGLGNPGEKFLNTPHNVGFAVLDFFAQKNNFPPFELSKKEQSLISQENIAGKSVVLAKPQTFMNESGKAVKKLLKNRKAQLAVVHDDIDLEIGKIKVVKERGSAGHKGVDSIIANVGNENLVRFRIGIATNNQQAQEVVLQKFAEQEQVVMNGVLQTTADALDCFINHGLEKTMNEFNR